MSRGSGERIAIAIVLLILGGAAALVIEKLFERAGWWYEDFIGVGILALIAIWLLWGIVVLGEQIRK